MKLISRNKFIIYIINSLHLSSHTWMNVSAFVLLKFVTCTLERTPSHIRPLPFLHSFLIPSWRAVAILPTPFGCKGPHFCQSLHLLLAEVFRGFLCRALAIILLSPLSLVADLSDVALGAISVWVGTRTGASGTARKF